MSVRHFHQFLNQNCARKLIEKARSKSKVFCSCTAKYTPQNYEHHMRKKYKTNKINEEVNSDDSAKYNQYPETK